MKKYLVLAAFLSLLLFVNVSMAAGSITITSQVLDSSVRPGGETTVFLTLTNPSTTASVTSVRLYILPGPYIISSVSYAEIGGLDASASQQTSLTLKIDSAAPSTTSYITTKVTYYTDSIQRETTANIPVTIKRIPILQLEQVTYTPNIIEPGNTVTLSIDLKNDGDGSAKDVKVSLNQTAKIFIVKGSPETFIDEITSKNAATISFVLTIDPSISIGTYSIPISLSYSDETKTSSYSSTKYIGLTITGKYNFVFALDSQDVIVPGKTGTITVKAANAGTQDAQFSTLTVIGSDYFESITPSVAYIGKISSDDYDTEKFTVKASDSAKPGNYPIQFQLEYKDSYGKSYNETFETNVRISSKEELPKASFSPFLILGLVLIIALVVFLVFKIIRKK
jgi:hypothetical protein